jgi:hypothetical protein
VLEELLTQDVLEPMDLAADGGGARRSSLEAAAMLRSRATTQK